LNPPFLLVSFPELLFSRIEIKLQTAGDNTLGPAIWATPPKQMPST